MHARRARIESFCHRIANSPNVYDAMVSKRIQLAATHYSMAGSTVSTAFCKVERRPSNQTVSSTAS